jgi:dolichol kinase
MCITTINTSTVAMFTANMLIAVVTYDYVSGGMTESNATALTLGLVLAVLGLTLLPSLLLRFPLAAA